MTLLFVLFYFSIKLAKIDWHHAIWTEDPRAKDFVRRCFVTDPRRRMGVRSALQHAWIRDVKTVE